MEPKVLTPALFPLNGAGWLRGNVVDHAINALHLVDDTAGDLLQHLVWQRDPICGHSVFRVDGADGAGVGVGALVAHHAHRHDRQQHGERLPDFSVEPGGFDLCNHDVIGLLQQRDALGGDLAEDANGKPGPGEGLALQNLFRHGEVAADAADLVFEKIFERLNELELHLFGQSTDVVVGLDGLRRAANGARFNDVGIQGALRQPFDFADLALDAVRLLLEDADEFGANDLALLFGVGDARKPG